MFIMARMATTILDEINQLFIALCMISLAEKAHPELQKYSRSWTTLLV